MVGMSPDTVAANTKDSSPSDSTNDQHNETSSAPLSKADPALQPNNPLPENKSSSEPGANNNQAPSAETPSGEPALSDKNVALSQSSGRPTMTQGTHSNDINPAGNPGGQPQDQPSGGQPASQQAPRQGMSSSIKSLLHGTDTRLPSASYGPGQTQLPPIGLHPPCPAGQSSSVVASSQIGMGMGPAENTASFQQQQQQAGSISQPTANRPSYQMPPVAVSSQTGGTTAQVGARRPSIPHGYPAQQPQLQQFGASTTSIDPRTFMLLATEELADSPQIMQEFRDTMKEFKEERLDMNQVIGRVICLFRGKRRLLKAFNSYLPDTCKLDIDTLMKQYDNIPPLGPGPDEGQTSYQPPLHLTRPTGPSSAGNELPPIVGPGPGWNVPLAGPPGAFPSIQTLNLPQSSVQQPSYHPSILGAQQQQAQQQKPMIQPASRIPPSAGPVSGGYASGMAPGGRQIPSSGQPPLGVGIGAQGAQLPSMVVSHSVQAQAPIQTHQPQPLSGTVQPSNGALNRVKNEELEPAVRYIQKVYNRYIHEPEIFKTFLDIVDEFPHNRKPLSDLYAQINSLFSANPDLVEDFNRFLPEHFGAFATHGGYQSVYPGSTSAALTGAQKFSQFQAQSAWEAVEAARKQAMPAGKQAFVAQKGQPLSYPKVQPVSIKEQPPLKKQKTLFTTTEDYRPPSEQFELFETIKKFLNSKQLYAEFARCLNLFNQDLIGIKDLLQIANNYLGRSPDLFNKFRAFVDLDESVEFSTTAERFKREKLGESIPQVDIAACKKYGSYRILPKMYRSIACSGRTDLASEVLNDLLVGCPQFASEEGSFIASKKNQFEELLFKCEDDRFDLDMLIGANQDTIHVLEAVDRKIQSLSLQERASFKLGPNLGMGTSIVIYKKAIGKVYGDHLNEIMEGLCNTPANTIPVVLNRLLAKDEEWKRVRRENQRMWRDIHTKNYYKALDHQSISFKTADKKTTNVKSLLAEIEMIARETKNPRSHHQILTVDQSKIMKDFLKVICMYIRNGLSLHSHEKNRLCSFFNSFFQTIFGFATLPTMSASAEHKNEEFGGHENMDISDDDSLLDKMEESPEKPSEVTSHSIFYSNSHLYALLRTFEIGYSRLSSFKSSIKSTSCIISSLASNENKVAVALDLQKPLLEAEETTNVYGSLIKMLCKFVTGRLDGNFFEEKARFLYGSSAFQLFTFDKLISSLVRQAQIILADPTCDNLLRLFDTVKTKSKRSFTEYSIKLASESLINQDNEPIYRIELVKPGTIGIKMLDKRHTLIDPSTSVSGALESVEEKWSKYIDKFVSEDNYDMIKDKRPPLFLQRLLKRFDASVNGRCPNEPWPFVYLSYGLECKINLNTYKMYFVEASEDFVLNTKNWPKVRQVFQKLQPKQRHLNEIFQ